GLATAAVVVEVSQPVLPDAADARAAWALATKRAAAIVPLACRKSDLAAHLAPGRIAVLLVECDEAGAQLVVARLRARL
ncbi:hypothetical protein ACSNOK_36375, partial [Streptomyces sp. URMC 126]|uniref:hypothetical protein n=1 Tax=Streptomyces sp. URMC 126 TaxID=3423401 RepID=UPI003F1A119F